jgi:hypothetical protein
MREGGLRVSLVRRSDETCCGSETSGRVDFDRRLIVIWEGKGNKDRITMLPR